MPTTSQSLSLGAAELRRVAIVLNQCIEACIDGQKIYAIAAATVRDPSLKELFQHHSDQRSRFVIQLQEALGRLGATPENEGTLAGSARMRWIEARHAFELHHDDHGVIRQCLRDQEAAVRRYVSAMRLVSASTLPVDVRVLLDEQLGSITLTLEETRHHLDGWSPRPLAAH